MRQQNSVQSLHDKSLDICFFFCCIFNSLHSMREGAALFIGEIFLKNHRRGSLDFLVKKAGNP